MNGDYAGLVITHRVITLPSRCAERCRRFGVGFGTGIPGNADNPMSWDDIATKFLECASVSVNPVTLQQLEKAIGLVRQLEHITDTTELMQSLS